MDTKEFKITISAPAEKVWRSLWDDNSYKQWTSAFTEGSRAETDWQEGSKVLFLDTNNDGMSSVIAKKMPDKYMSFKHMGSVKKGVENCNDPADDAWRGAHENYILKDLDGGTLWTVELDITAEYADYMAEKWPLAMQKVKELAEG